MSAYTEEEFKKVLKTLLSEKKKAHDLKEKLLSIEKEDSAKENIEKNQEEIITLRKQLEKVKPAFQKLIDEIKEGKEREEKLFEQLEESRSELEELKGKKNFVSEEEWETLKSLCERAISEKEEAILHKEEIEAQFTSKNREVHEECARLEGERQKLVERLAETLAHMQRQGDILADFQEEVALLKNEMEAGEEHKRKNEKDIHELKGMLTQAHAEIARVKNAYEQDREEFHQKLKEKEKELEGHKNALFNAEEKAALLESQLTESDHAKIQADWEEKTKLALLAQQEAFELTLQSEKREAEEYLKTQLRDKERGYEEVSMAGHAKVAELGEKLASLHDETQHLKDALKQKEAHLDKAASDFESLLQSFKNMQMSCEDKEGEIKKAQQHLAKKIKESTLLRDMVERQNMQITQLQNNLANQKMEIERMQNSLELQRSHEEKIHAMAKERALAAENLSKEWQEKYFALQEECQLAKAESMELQKIKKSWEQMSTTLANIRSLLSKSLPEPIFENGKPFFEGSFQGAHRDGEAESPSHE